MTQPSVNFSEPSTFVEKLAAYFHSRPNLWIDGKTLALIAGGYAWRSRCADLRKPPYSMRIENRQQRIRTAEHHKFTISEYRYVP